MNKTGVIFFPAFDWSLGELHPEREERLLYTQEQIFEEGIMDLPQIKQFSPSVADIGNVLRTQAIFPGPKNHSLDAHLIAVGSSLVLGNALMNQEITNGFAMVRPPGHHAGATVWGNRGFCTLNTEAILINYLRATYGIKRIAVVDTDVHHGDGTQDIFYHDPNVLFISLHQDGRTLYPGTGFVEEKGGPNAWDSVLNIPLLPGTGDEGILYALENWIMPRVEAFKPDMIINSAGQDNHFTDPLASMNVTARGYGKITERIKPDLAVLEGGYSIEGALPYINMAILLALSGEDYSGVIEPQRPKDKALHGDAVISYLNDLRRKQEKVAPSWNYRNDSFLPEGKWVYNEKSIYYDTDGFNEHRKDYIRQCSHCGGTVLIFSQKPSAFQKGVLIRIPFDACPQCEQAGYDLAENLIKSENMIMMQNQLKNKVHMWHNGEEVSPFGFKN
ncbi:histone deacetylase [Dehalobacter sp. DCM]|uniref:histone deacetylase family protein n=1 Tax=Dehalobacter sp. DCM TaxID=2907827 RepID=UPI0030820F67|nr:histone deacetylase [Dehalobacter sp. DCM]